MKIKFGMFFFLFHFKILEKIETLKELLQLQSPSVLNHITPYCVFFIQIFFYNVFDI